jgi:hypothetical protein
MQHKFASLGTAFATAVFLLYPPQAAFAQTATGILRGVVTDSTSAAVVGATVNIESQATAVKQTLETNPQGIFVLPYLLPGSYKVTVEKTGFKKYQNSEVRIGVQQTVELEVQLTVGELSSTIEVMGSVATLSTTSSTVSTVIDNKKILDLPLNGRNVLALANLVPGVIPAGGGYAGWISGGRNANTEVTVDGTSIVLPENNVSIQQLALTPSVDSIEEFTVITNALAAELGRTAGGAFNISTRSGSNTLHGSAFEFLRNSALNANSWANNRNGAPKNPVKNHQFGGTLGGPVVLPKLYNGRNRTFFFLSEQSERQRSAAASTATVPIEAWRNGDFSNLRNGSGVPVVIYDPNTATQQVANGVTYFTRTPLAGNRVPAERITAFAKKLQDFYPTPNATPNNVNTQQNNFFASGTAVQSNDKFDIRLDHNFSDKFKVWGRGSYQLVNNTPFNGFRNIATSIGDGPLHQDNYAHTATAVYTLNPTTIFQFTYGFTRFAQQRLPFSRDYDIRQLGLPQYMYDAGAAQGLEFPQFTISGNAGVSNLGQAGFTTLLQYPTSHNTRFDVTKILSKHTIKMGYQYNKLLMNFTQLGQPTGQFTFGDTFTKLDSRAGSTNIIGSGYASFLMGLATGGQQSHTFSAATASSYYGLYIQDDYKITSRLTLNIGLRWDADSPHTERFNRLSYFDYDAPSPIAGKVPGFANLKGAMKFVTPENRRQVPTDLNNFGPRFGFSYKVNNKTVFRGAYGILYGVSVMQAAGTSGSSGTQGFQSTTGFTASVDGGGTPFTNMSNPFPLGLNLPRGSADSATGGAFTELGGSIGESFFNDSQTPMGQQWNANIQRELGGGWIAEVGYLGSKWQHLNDGESSMAYNQLNPSFLSLRDQLQGSNRVANPFYNIIPNHPQSLFNQPTIEYNQLLRPFPQYRSVSAFRKPQGNSLYHSMTVGVTKRFSKGMSAQFSFTGGKLIDDVSQTVTFLGQAGTKQDFYNRGNERSISSQDVAKRFVASIDYELPFGRGRKFMGSTHKAIDVFVGGWQANGIVTLQGGIPLAMNNNGQNNVFLGNPGQRVTSNGKNPRLDGPIEGRLNRYFDTSVFSITPNYTFGTVGRFVPNLRVPGTRNVDFSLFKNFKPVEKITIQFRAEAYNIANHPTWGTPGTNPGASSGYGEILTASGNRTVQLAMKLYF